MTINDDNHSSVWYSVCVSIAANMIAGHLCLACKIDQRIMVAKVNMCMGQLHTCVWLNRASCVHWRTASKLCKSGVHVRGIHFSSVYTTFFRPGSYRLSFVI